MYHNLALAIEDFSFDFIFSETGKAPRLRLLAPWGLSV